jgi:hypothetical protein
VRVEARSVWRDLHMCFHKTNWGVEKSLYISVLARDARDLKRHRSMTSPYRIPRKNSRLRSG